MRDNMPTEKSPTRPVCSALLLVALLTSCNAPHNEETHPITPPTPLTSNWLLQDAAKLHASPEQLSSPAFSPTDWHHAVVPGTVLTSLVADATFPEPLFGENNRPDKIPDSLARTSWWYRTEFTPPPLAPDRHLWLNLHGINYIADLWINGKQIATMRGAFTRGNFDITPFITPQKPATLAIHILPPPHPGTPIEQTLAAGTGPNGGILALDGPTFLCTIGWDWIPGIRDRDIGLWQKIDLSQTGPVRIENPLITSDLPLPRTDFADLSVSTTVRNLTDSDQVTTLTAAFATTSLHTTLQLHPHESRLLTFTPKNFPQLHLHNPQLWWPNGYGPQNLYTLHLTCTTNNTLSDSLDTHFGIRKISYHVPASDNLTLSVNGVPIIAKGGDWGIDEAMKRSPHDRLEAQIRMHALANYTILRNWVGQSTSDDFYDLCDQYGLLIWDEMFQPNPSDGPNPDNPERYLANVREKVLRFRNHPSIAVWCARNEGNPPPDIDFGIQQIMHELEPTRLYQKNSADGRGVRSGGPYCWREPREFYQFPESEAFKTEIGSISIPTLEAIHHMMPEKDWWPINDDWAEHDFCKGAQQGDRFVTRLADRYGPSDSLEDFTKKGQLATYEAYRAMYEGRFAKLFHPVTGVITWMSNPAQPSFVWQLYTHDLEPNAALFATRLACEPLHIQFNQATDHLQIINATPTARESLHARLRLFDINSTQLLDQTLPADAPALAATDLGTIHWPQDLPDVHFLKLELFDAENHLLSENFYWRTLKTVPLPPSATQPTTQRLIRQRPPLPQEDFQQLQSLPPTTLTLTAQKQSPTQITATLTNPSDHLALLTHLQLRNAETGNRILPVYYSNNYLTLLPHETKSIQIEAPTLPPNTPLAISVDAFNTTPTLTPVKE